MRIGVLVDLFDTGGGWKAKLLGAMVTFLSNEQQLQLGRRKTP